MILQQIIEEVNVVYLLIKRFYQILGLGILVLLLAGCGGGGGGGFSGGGQEQTTTTPAEPLSITTDSLEDGTVGQTYLQLLEVQGGASNTVVQWVSQGQLPPGVTLDSSLGKISGIPTTAGTYPFLVQAQDTQNSSLNSAIKEFSITIDPAPGSGAAKVKDVQLLASSPQLSSAGDSPVTLTALVRDINNNTLKDATVTFKADNNGTIQVTRSNTDAAGTAEALLTTKGYQENRQINITASTGGIEDSTKVDVIGTNITIAGPAAVGVGEQALFTFNLLDSAGKGISNQTLSVSSKNLNSIIPPSPITDTSGKAQVQIRGDNNGADVITVSGAGATAQQSLAVSPDKLVFISPNPSASSIQEITINTSFTITVEWKQNGLPVTNARINFTATRGTITSTATTDATGRASVNIQSDTAGRSLIVATTDSGLSVQIEVLFVATQPYSFYLQANPTTLNPFQQSTVKALVFDPNGNPVKGVTVNFNLSDPTGGVLSNPSAVTNESGETTTTYTAAATISGVNQAQITATVVQNTNLRDTATITVGGKAVFIRFGTGNLIEVPDSVTYSKPYRVWVTDVAGNPVIGATLKLSVIPLSYSKGKYNPPDPKDSNQTKWQQSVAASGCKNEDVNLNGRLDIPPDVDENNNGKLDPGNVASVAATVVTGDDGSVLFGVKYGRNYADWVTVQLTGSTNVAGSEATESTSFTLPVVVSDLSNKDVNPPNNPSPFGTANSCANPN